MRLKNDRYEYIKKEVVKLFHSCNITSFPIRYETICLKKGYSLVPYSNLSPNKIAAAKKISTDGFHMLIQRKDTGEFTWLIYYNDSNSKERIRWTILHEIGHILLDHTEESDLSEAEANFFAKYALAPPPLIHVAKCDDYIDIARKFDISVTAAFYAMKCYKNWLQYGPISYLDYEVQMLHLFGIAA